ncbi:phosphoglucomutase (alpha-D-glucose-1,6-bisphosphate-dependent) [Streptomyces sp. URMC 129]|uniref:phosphoglucomutase (alpha-D-glucose-1,6-bisphosphate-dependent) n=1 Tax=Streptomyces sp. URMC 129 TaxID=3423407 RepID=UPI003F199984
MPIHPRAGTPALAGDLVDVASLTDAYYRGPDPSAPEQRVAFGTSGHRGSSLRGGFNEAHILAIAQALCDHRAAQGITGPLFLGLDPHALSEPAGVTALEVFAANGVTVLIDDRDGYTPTPAVSHAILSHNRGGTAHRADGVVITPSHNPPSDGGFKYNPPHGGPADTAVTRWIQERANALLDDGLAGVRRVPWARAKSADTTGRYDFLGHYVDDLPAVVDLRSVKESGLRVAADPMGGASVAYWAEIASRHGLDITVTQPTVDPTWRFMPLDHDGRIRMDCSSPWAMAALVERSAGFDLAVGNDPDADRHGIVTPDAGLMRPNDYLAVAVDYLIGHRPDWPPAAVGKTVVSSSLIDRVAGHHGRPLVEVPVGFKWFVPGLLDATLVFGGEESAGAAMLRRDGTVWTTDKDGIALCLLAAEITATTGTTPAERYAVLAERLGSPLYERTDVPATADEKRLLGHLSADRIPATELAGEPITAILTEAPDSAAPIGGLKVSAPSGWFAARPSGTEDVYKIYAESFRGRDHLRQIQDEARTFVSAALNDR